MMEWRTVDFEILEKKELKLNFIHVSSHVSRHYVNNVLYTTI